MVLWFTSRRLPSTRRAMNGNAAMTSGTMLATVPTTVPTISRVRGNTNTMRIRKGTERSRLMTTSSVRISHPGRGRTPFFSPTTRMTPSGRPMTMAKAVDKMVTYTVSQIASGT